MFQHLVTFLVLLFCNIIFGQQLAQVDPNSEKKPVQNIAQTHFFAGQIDDLYNVNIDLSCKNGKCHGTLIYTESGTTFQLEGLQQGNTLLLQEMDAESAISGFIKATWIDGQIQGEWTNFNGSIGSHITLQKVANKEAIVKLFNEKWVKVYRGIILWDEVEMIIHHLGHNQLSGSIYYKNQDEEKPISGFIDADGKMNFSIKNTAGMEEATLVTKSIVDQNFRAVHTNIDGKQNYSSFELKHKIPVGYIEYADYVTSYEILFPEYTNKEFNQWVKKSLQDWTKYCRSQVQSIKKIYPVCKPQARASERAYVWFEVEKIDADWIIGQFFFSNTWNTQTASKTINFNLRTGKSVEGEQLFKKNQKGFEAFKKEYIAQELRRNPRYMDSGFREWVKKESFPLLTIQTNGIQFHTLYDETYGQVKVTIPYEKLKPFLKRKTALNTFF